MLSLIMAICFITAHTIWTIQLSKQKEPIGKDKKIHAVSFATAFLLGILLSIFKQDIMVTVLFMIGLVVSEFSIAIAFYDKLKDLEIPYE